jgi:hypothetical protein
MSLKIVEALALLRAVARDQVGVARVLLVVQVAAEDLEFLRERRLRPRTDQKMNDQMTMTSACFSSSPGRLIGAFPEDLPEPEQSL